MQFFSPIRFLAKPEVIAMPRRSPYDLGAWTLIELIGVVAVIAILSAALVPTAIREIDRMVADQEVSTLKTFSTAFQQYILGTRTIPDATTWNTAIAGKLGFSPNDVLYNTRQQSHQSSRVFLIDPSLQLSPSSPPSGLLYQQSTAVASSPGTPMLPVNPRFMIVSSLGKALPSAVASGVFSAGHPEYFANLWNATDGTVPSDTVWSGWKGNAADVIVQRINLTPLFVRLAMGKYNSPTFGYYTIDGTDGTTAPTGVTSPSRTSGGVDGYFIQGTVLTLYTNNPSDQTHAVDTKQILNSDTTYVFEQGVWRNSLQGASVGVGSANMGDLVQQFLEATPNTNSAAGWPVTPPNAQQALVVTNMLKFMTDFNTWAYTNNFDTKAIVYKTTLPADENALMDSLEGLYKLQAFKRADGSYCCYPTNGIP
jgi:type II secretory pathway pseudopilin PulG